MQQYVSTHYTYNECHKKKKKIIEIKLKMNGVVKKLH